MNNSFVPRNAQAWRKAVRVEWGERACLSDNPKSDLKALEDNWRVIELPWSFANSLRYILPNSTQVIAKGKKRRLIPKKDLSPSQREFLSEITSYAYWIAEEAGYKTYPVKVFVDERKELGFFVNTGFCNHEPAFVGVEIDTINRQDYTKAVGTILHEFTHLDGKHEDNTRDFENDLTSLLAMIAMKNIVLAKKLGLTNF